MSTQEYYQMLLTCIVQCSKLALYIIAGLYCTLNCFALYKLNIPRTVRLIRNEKRKIFKFLYIALIGPAFVLKAAGELLKNEK